MQNRELSDEEEAVLAVELVRLISRAKYPLSDRIRALGAILNKAKTGTGPTSTPAAAEAI